MLYNLGAAAALKETREGRTEARSESLLASHLAIRAPIALCRSIRRTT